jgi:hypothetical protein
VEQERFDRELASTCIIVDVIDEAEVTVVNIDHVDGFRVKPFSVVDGEVPIAVRPACSLCPGAAERDTLHPGHVPERIRDMVNEADFEIVI